MRPTRKTIEILSTQLMHLSSAVLYVVRVLGLLSPYDFNIASILMCPKRPLMAETCNLVLTYNVTIHIQRTSDANIYTFETEKQKEIKSDFDA